MNPQNRVAIRVVVLILSTLCMLGGCNSQKQQSDTSIKNLIYNYTNAISDRNLCGMELKVYYVDSPFFVYGSYSAENLICEVEDRIRGKSFYFRNQELIEYRSLLSIINEENLTPVSDGFCSKKVFAYFLFESDENNKILEIEFGGYSDIENCVVMFVNGLPVKYNELFAELVSAFCPGISFP